jgi:hypothetical protein
MVPAQDKIDQYNADEKPPGKDPGDHGVVSVIDKGRNGKAETEMDELTDDLPHDR